jgi:hypothetical protein
MRAKTGIRIVAAALATLATGGACAADRRAPIQTIAGHEAASADVVVDWNVVALRTTAAAPFDPPRETRNLAMVQGAVFDAVNSITGGFTPYLDTGPAPSDASTSAAAIGAAHDVLAALYPAQQAALDDEYRASLADVPDGPAKDAGLDAGRRAAAHMLSRRAGDGADEAVLATEPESEPAVGTWRPTPPDQKPPLDPGWGRVTPFVLERGSQFRPDAPYQPTSEAYARDFAEVKKLGSEASTDRTREQTDTARFWAATGPQLWSQPVQQLAIGKHLTVTEAARLFAHVNLAGADAAIAAWDTKFAFRQWRPVTGIQEAGADGNPATTADPQWTPLLATPPFPDYVCGHSTFAGALEAVLESYFGHRPGVTMTMTSAAAPGVTHRFTSFAAISDEVVDARVWAGAHWRTSCTAGRSVGLDVGRVVSAETLRPVRG